MSKRVAESQGGASRYGGEDRDTAPEEAPRKATAAQLAKRSIKPLRRPGAAASRSTSPNKPLTPSMNNAFGAPQQQSFGGFGAASSTAPQQFGSNQFSASQQSGPTPPSSTSFSFGATAPVSNPFASAPAPEVPTFMPSKKPGTFGVSSTAQPTNFAMSKQPGTFGVTGAAQPQTQSFGGFSPAPQGTSTPNFSTNFGGPSSATSNGAFTFGANTPTKPAETVKPATNGTPAFGGTSTGNMFGQTQAPKPACLSDDEILEIELGGSCLSAEQMSQLEKIVRDCDSKYQNATSLAGLNLRELPLDAQKKMLAFVKDPSAASTVSHMPYSGFQQDNQANNSFYQQPQQTPSFASSTQPSQTSNVSHMHQSGIQLDNHADDYLYQPPQTPSFGTPSSQVSYQPFSESPHYMQYTQANTFFNQQQQQQQPPPQMPSFGSTQASQTSSFGASTPAASNPFANISRPAAESTPKPAMTFATSASNTSSTPFKGFGASAASPSFGASAASTSKSADTVSYPDLNGATSQTEPSSSASKVDFTKVDTPKPGSNGFTSFNPPPAKGLGNSMFNPASSNGAGSSVFSSASPQPAASSSFKFGSTDTSSPKKDAAPPATPFKLGNSASAQPVSATPKTAAPFASTQKPELFTTAPTPPPAAGTPKFAAPTPSFGGFVPPASKPSSSPAPSSSASKPASADRLAPPATTSNSSSSSNMGPPPARLNKLRDLNEGFRKHLASQNPDNDWTNIIQFYLEQASKISASQAPVKPASQQPSMSNGASPVPAMQKRKADDEASRDDGNKRSKAGATDFSQSMSASSPNKPLTQTASLFNDILNTPPADKTPAKAPATATPAPSFTAFTPVSNKVTAPPAETPKANPFATLTKVSNTPAAPPAQGTPAATTASPSLSKINTTTGSSSSPFKINRESMSAPATSGFSLPKFGGGVGASAPNFLSSFGSRAAEEEKKEREKRKLEDLDSDDDEDEWEKKDAEEQAAKRQKMLEDAAKAAKPSFKPFTPSTSTVFKLGGEAAKTAPTPSSTNIFGHLSPTKGQADEQEDEEQSDDDGEEDAEEDESATPAKPAAASSQSLFDRIEKPVDSIKPIDSFELLKNQSDSSKPAAAASTPFKFGGASSNTNIFGSAASPAGDNTWKGDSSTPVKFGKPAPDASATPAGSPAKNAFGGLAGNATAPPKFGGFNPTSVLDKPAPKFGGFGKSVNSSTEAPNTSASVFASASKPSAGFTFGTPSPGAAAPAAASTTSSVFGNSNATSGASTPITAANTDGEEASGKDANEPSDDVKDKPQQDLASLSPSEINDNDLVFESKSKASKFTEGEDGQKSWQGKGLGIFRLLKDKQTGNYWCLMRMTPGGQIILKSALVKKSVEGAYLAMGKVCRMTAVDDAGKVSTWGLQFGTLEKVEELVKLMKAGQPEQ